MHLSGHRAIRALAVFLVLAIGIGALLPLTARAAGQVTGVVSTCGTITPFVNLATVSLVDANGVNPTLNAVTNGAGVYTFTPPSGSYTVSVSRAGYYGNATSVPKRFDGSTTTRIDICLVAQPTPAKVLKVHVQSAGSPISGATVSAFNLTNPTGKPQLVRTNTTNASGDSNLTLWSGSFQLRTSAATYQTDSTTVDVSVTTSVTINLVGGNEIFGQVTDSNGNFLGSGVVAWLYDPGAPITSAYRLIAGTVSASAFDIHAPAGTYTIIVDADGYLAYKNTVILPGVPNPYDVVLLPAPKEIYRTTVSYGTQDWNNLTVWRNLTLNSDSTLTGLTPANLRDLRLQVDTTLGNNDGSLIPAEITAFHDWLVTKGPGYVTTDGFLTTNGRGYVNVSSYTVTVEKLDVAGSRVWINTTAHYTVKQAPPWIANGAKDYFANMTMVPDTNSTAYQDYVYVLILPKRYELNMTTFVPSNAPVTTASFTTITIDPGVTTGTPQARMKMSQSVVGTARAKVVAPIGKFYVENASFTNYRAFVAGNTSLTLSGEDSTDPNGHITAANFTWKFGPSNTARWGIRTNFTYTQAGLSTVNLTVTEAGGNVTYRDITLFVDDQVPLAEVRTNLTGSASANGKNLSVNEGTAVRFDGGFSTDFAYTGKKGVILNTGYSWDFDADRIADATGRIINWTFRKPGQFKVNLTVTDSVGWKSLNATMNATVNDTKGPSPGFDILDPSKDWAVINSPMERKTIAMNASRTTDDHDNLSALNFTWTIPGPLIGYAGTNHTFYGVNISFAWKEWNNSYHVTLSARDTGFGSGKGNTGNFSRNITVQIDTSIHADLKIELDPISHQSSLKISPSSPEEGSQLTVSVNVTNKLARLTASNVTTNLYAITGGVPVLVASQAQWFDKNGAPKAHTIGPGETVKLVFTATLSGQGNKTLQVYVYDSTEPFTWLSDNRAQTPVNVRQPAWQPYAIYGSVVGIIVLFVFGMYARRKIKAGEWRPIRGRRRERGEGEEKRPKKEVKEEKKRL